MISEVDIESKRLELELDRDSKKWKVRRRISISAFVINCIIGFTYLLLLPNIFTIEELNTIKDYNSIIITIIGSNSSIVLMYIGAATYSDSHGNKVTSK